MQNKMDANMQTLRGEMQSMGLNLQAGQEAMRTGVRGIMAAPRGRATEPTRGSANCVRPAMETGKVEGTSDVTIDGETETCRVRHEGTTEKLKEVMETGDINRDKRDDRKSS